MTTTEPVLVTGFNRPEALRRVIDRLRQVKPSTIYLAIDGPRASVPSDAELVHQCRELTQLIDWDCELHTLFQDENLGCGRGMSVAISWFFDEVERGIVLEDDVLPEATFFGFCAELLDRYADDDRVFAISGCNLVPAQHLTHASAPYRFSRIPTVWGWASWRRSWRTYRLDIRDWKSELSPQRLLRRLGNSPAMAAMWATEFELTGRGNVDTWDWQLTFAAMRNDQLVATSNVNLVENIGFGADATHTHGAAAHLDPPQPIQLPMEEVPVVWDKRADEWATRNHFGGSVLTSADRLRQYAMSPRTRNAPWL